VAEVVELDVLTGEPSEPLGPVDGEDDEGAVSVEVGRLIVMVTPVRVPGPGKVEKEVVGNGCGRTEVGRLRLRVKDDEGRVDVRVSVTMTVETM
jgi:hypothetical protein